jgi:hypothetical protein
MRIVQIRVPVQAKYENPLGPPPTNQVAEQPNGGIIGPVQVVEHEQERLLRGQFVECRAYALKENVAARPGIGTACIAPLLAGRRGQEIGEYLGAVYRRRPMGQSPVASGVLECTNERLERDDRIVVTPTPEHTSAILFGFPGELTSEAGLADSGLAAEEGDLTLAVHRARPGETKVRQLRVATDKRTRDR